MSKEVRDIQSEPSLGITITLVDGSLYHLVGCFPGPVDTPYQGGMFSVDIQVPDRYPFVPLAMRFITRVYHCNVSSTTGAICLDILKDAWSPVLTIKSALISLQSMLSSPEPDNPQDAEVARHLLTDRKGFEITARDWTARFARAAGGHAGGDNAQTAGLEEAHIDRFTAMGFERQQVIAVLGRFNYRGESAQDARDDRIVQALIG